MKDFSRIPQNSKQDWNRILFARRVDLLAMRMELLQQRTQRFIEGKFDENQPRVPAGQSGGGQWVSDEIGNFDPNDITGRSPAPPPPTPVRPNQPRPAYPYSPRDPRDPRPAPPGT